MKIKSVIVISFLLIITLFVGCTNNNGNNNETTPTQADTQPQTETQTTQPQTEPLQDETKPEETLPEETKASTVELIGKWSAVDGESVASEQYATLGDILGSGAMYGGVLELKEDETFTLNVGIESSDGKNAGTYTQIENDVSVKYTNGEEDIFYYISDYNGNEALKVKHGDYFIYFVK